jgi:hypothetical protein
MLTIWTVPQLYGDSEHGYGYRIRFGLSKSHQNAPIFQYIDLKSIERTKTEARVFLQDEATGPWVLISGFDIAMNDVALGLAAVQRLLMLRGVASR